MYAARTRHLIARSRLIEAIHHSNDLERQICEKLQVLKSIHTGSQLGRSGRDWWTALVEMLTSSKIEDRQTEFIAVNAGTSAIISSIRASIEQGQRAYER